MRSTRHAVFVILACAVTAVPATGQELVTAQELMAIPRPPADQRIAYGPDPLQFGDLYLPEGPGPHPVLAFIHGGCFLSQYDIGHTASFSRAVADEGYAVWSLEYRRVGDTGGGWPVTWRDVARGIDHLRTIAGAHALDLERVAVSGHSAGGTLALWAAARDRLPEASELRVADPLQLRAVLGLAAVGDLEAIHMIGVCGGVVDRLMGGSPAQRSERYAAVSPMSLVPLDVPVTFVVGRHDSWTPPSLSWVYRARAVGTETIEIVELPDSGHFEMILPTSSSWPRVVEALHRTFERIGP